jgi:hypothetical protein
MDLVSETSQGLPQTSPLQRNGRRVFWLVVLVSVPLVTGIFLFSDAVDTLRRLVGRFEDQATKKISRTSRLPLGPAGAGVPALQTISLPLRSVETPKPELAGQFLRTWQISGPNICKALRDAGVETTEWRAASMRSVSYECYFQRVYKRDEVRPLSSVHLKIRGNARGDIFEIRAKIVGPKTDAQGRLDPALMRIFETLVEQAGWNDFQDTLAPIRSLRDVEGQRFGADFSFKRDAESENSFNFMWVVAAVPGPQTRTQAYFSADRWVTPPDPWISGDLLPAWQLVKR